MATSGRPDLGAQAQQLLVQPVLLGDLVVLELEEEAVRAQDVGVRPGDAPRRLPVVGLERPGDLAVEARRQADEPRAVLGEVVAVDARLVVVAVDVGVGDDAAQVLVARPVLRQQDQVEGLGVLAALPVGHRPAGDVGLDADDGLDALLLAGLVERDRPVQRAVVGDGQRIEAQPGRLRRQVIDAPETVEQAELRVDVEVREVVRGDGHRRPRPYHRRGLGVVDAVERMFAIWPPRGTRWRRRRRRATRPSSIAVSPVGARPAGPVATTARRAVNAPDGASE